MKNCVEAVLSSVKINETWSAVDLRVEAFSLIIEAFCEQRLVLISGGSSSLPGETGKREQGVEAPF